jgi:hypothetical protein
MSEQRRRISRAKSMVEVMLQKDEHGRRLREIGGVLLLEKGKD